jgi:peptidoglycan DL-endopeptidase CwlO
MKKSIAVLSATILLGTGLYTATPTFAERPAEIQQKIDENRNKQAKVEEQIAKIENAIKENEKIIAKTEKDIKLTQDVIDQLNADKKHLQKKMEERKELIKERLRLMQQNGGNKAYLDIILGSTNFTELVSRTNAVSKIIEADQNLVEEQKRDAKLLAKKEKESEEKLMSLKDKKLELEGIQATISEQKAQAEALKKQLLNTEEDLIQQKKEAEEAERRRIEEERARRQAELQARQAETQTQTQTRQVESQIRQEETQDTQAQSQTAQSQSINSTPSKSSTKKETKKDTKVKNSTSTPSASAGNAIGIVTSIGKQFIGNSVYVWGAQDPARGYFDCSGFVNWAFKQAGISVGRSTSVLSSQGTKVSVNEMRPGDLVFFDTYKKDGHVGIYLGNGNFIGSQSSTGVAIASMTSGYWKQHFSGHVRRVIK